MQSFEKGLEYSINNFQAVVDDMEERTQLLDNFRSVMDKKISLEKEHSEKLSLFAQSNLLKKVENAKNTSQIIFNGLITTFKTEAEHLESYVQNLKKITNNIENAIQNIHRDSKKYLTFGKSFNRDKQILKEGLEKNKIKFEKKSEELKKIIEEYLIGMIGELSFDKKNKIYIKIKEAAEKEYPILKAEYLNKFEQHESFMTANREKMDGVMKKLAGIEENKLLLMKDSFIHYHLERSNYGAFYVQDAPGLLTQVSDIVEKFPQLTHKNTFKQMSKNRIVDPCGYINKLFRSLQNHQTQNLILFGQSAEHKSFLHQSMTDEVIDDAPPEDKSGIFQVSRLFRSVFDANQEFNQEKAKKLKKLMNSNAESRKNFILCLQKFRHIGRFQIQQNNLASITQILNNFLDLCKADHDTYNSKLLMVLSFTYYTVQQDQKKFLQECIRGHEIWEDRYWWECAFLQSVYEQAKVKAKKEEEIIINIWDIKGAGIRLNELCYGQTFQSIVFNQLIYYLHNMKLFLIEEKVMTSMARRYVRMFELPLKMAEEIQKISLRESSIISVDDDNSTCGDSGSKKSFFRFFS